MTKTSRGTPVPPIAKRVETRRERHGDVFLIRMNGCATITIPKLLLISMLKTITSTR